MSNFPRFWTDEKVAKMREMAEQGMSASEIGRVLRCSRNAVIGKMDRVKIRAGIKPERIKALRPRLPKLRLPVRRAPKLVVVKSAVNMPAGNGVGIFELTGCKWAIGYDEKVIGRHLFCNSELHDHRYCQQHAAESRASYSVELVNKTVKQALKAHKAAA